MTARLLIALGLLALIGCDSNMPAAPTRREDPTRSPVAAPLPFGSNGPTAIPGTQISVGTAVRAVIGVDDPACYPNWDSSGRCRQFDLTPAEDASLDIVLTWEVPSRGVYDPELFVGSPGTWWIYSEDTWPARHVRIQGKAGTPYRIVVIGYGAAQPFELRVDVE